MDTYYTVYTFLSLCLCALCTVTVQQDLSCHIDLGYEFVLVAVGFIIPYNTYINLLQFMLRLSWKRHTVCVRKSVVSSVLHFVVVCVQLYMGGYYVLLLLFSTINLSIIPGRCLAKPILSIRCVRKISNDLISCLPFVAFFFLLLLLCGDIELNPGPA